MNDLYGELAEEMEDLDEKSSKSAKRKRKKKRSKKKAKKAKRDACYHKVKARYDVWPSAYASGALVKCRKVGAANWGNSKKEQLQATVEDELTKVLLERQDIEEAYLPFIGGKMKPEVVQQAINMSKTALSVMDILIDDGYEVAAAKSAKDDIEDAIKRLSYYVNNRTSKADADKAWKRFTDRLNAAHQLGQEGAADANEKERLAAQQAALQRQRDKEKFDRSQTFEPEWKRANAREKRAYEYWANNSGLGSQQDAWGIWSRLINNKEAKAKFIRLGGSEAEWPMHVAKSDAPLRKRGAGRLPRRESIEDLVYYTLFEVLEEKKRKKKRKLTAKPSSETSLRDWFGRKGAKGKKGGWVDCNTCRKDKKTGRKKCSACGRSGGEKRSKYPSCRPTPGACGKRGKWGKKSKKGKKG